MAGWALAIGMAISGCARRDMPQETTLSAGGQRFEIASSSMAPTLLGRTTEGVCDACSRVNLAAAETFRPELPFRCYHCGGVCSVADRIRPGTEVTVTALQDTEWIPRFTLVAFRPSPESEIQVKRVWGMPGESLEIDAGELQIDGKPLRKSLAELEAVAIPVATWPDDSPCWIASPDGLAWQHHRPAAVHPQETARDQWMQPAPLNDDYAINQGVSYATYPSDDLLVSLDLERPLDGSLWIKCQYRQQAILIRAVGKEAMPDETQVQQGAYSCAMRAHLEIGLCDGRLLLSADEGREVAHLLSQSHEQTSESSAAHQSSNLSIWVGAETEIRRLAIARDIVLRSDRRNAMQSQRFAALPAAHYLLLGDNQPVSRDSRHELGAVARSQIVGVVVADNFH